MSEVTYQPPDFSLLGEEHVQRYQETDGEVGYIWNGVPILLLTTKGRQSGTLHTTPLIHGRDGADYFGGGLHGRCTQASQLVPEPRTNLSARVQVQAEQLDVNARTAGDAEKPRLWKIVRDLWPNYDVYQSRTDRVIPIVVLSPSN